jgi:antitoxin component YwqK of YwqJK toxin-antitoxin module
MRKYIVILLILLAAQAKAQNLKMDFEAEHYKHTITFADHQLVFQLQPLKETLKFTDPEKIYYWYSNNQIKTTRGGYSGKLLHGFYTDFYANNSLKEQGRFKMGLKVGEWKAWSGEGLLVVTTYKHGMLKQQKPSWLKRRFTHQQ